MTVPVVQVVGTPNPNAAKFVLNSNAFGAASRTYFDADSAAGDDLATKLFAVVGVRALFMVEDFITVTKADAADWESMVDAIRSTIEGELGG